MKEIILRITKYVFLIICILEFIAIQTNEIEIRTFYITNLIVYLIVIAIIIVKYVQIRENHAQSIHLTVLIICTIFCTYLLIKDNSLKKQMTILEIINIYCLGIDVFRCICIKIKIITINTTIELMTIFNNLTKKRIKGKNILILISRLNNGGAERTAVNLAENLAKKYNVTILSYYPKTKQDYPLNNIEHIVIEGKELSLIRKIKKIKKQRKINYCISFCTNSNFLNIASRYRENVIVSIRNFLSLSEANKIDYKKNKKISKYADKIIAVSKAVEQDEIENFHVEKEKITTIENFYEKEKIEKQINSENTLNEKEEEIFKNHKVIITSGRLEYQKAQGNLIRAFKEVVNKNNSIKLIIIGQGKLEQELKLLIKELQLENNVFLLGFKTNPYQYLKKADVFILPSLYEGMSNVVLEAMACGLPIIATDSKGGNREIIAPNKKEEYGVLIPVPIYNISSTDKISSEEKQMAQAILEMVENEQLREHYKQQSLKRIQDFSKDKIMKKWYKIIES